MQMCCVTDHAINECEIVWTQPHGGQWEYIHLHQYIWKHIYYMSVFWHVVQLNHVNKLSPIIAYAMLWQLISLLACLFELCCNFSAASVSPPVNYIIMHWTSLSLADWYNEMHFSSWSNFLFCDSFPNFRCTFCIWYQEPPSIGLNKPSITAAGA